ncbi:MAG: YfhO family protein [bacterium]|nr:YfhO family protein [bacterium]
MRIADHYGCFVENRFRRKMDIIGNSKGKWIIIIMKYDKRNLLIILFLAVLIFIFFSKLFLSDYIYYAKDFFRYFYPTHYFASHWIREGIIPLWNPYNSCGVPFLAALQSQVLYPFSFIIYFLPINFGMKLFIATHLFLAGIFTYLLMQQWKTSKTSSLISSIVYIFSGYFISVVDILNILVAITWIPFIFWAYVLALRTFKFRYIILTAIGIGLQFLGGEPTTFCATLLTLALFTSSKVVVEWREGRRQKAETVRLNGHASRNRGWNTYFKIPLVLVIVVLISLGLVAFQLLPFLEMVSHSTRYKGSLSSGMSFAEATRWSLAPYELLDLFAPSLSYVIMRILGEQGLIDSIYLGIIPLCFIFIGICFSRLALFWMLIFICFILLSSGHYFLLYKWLYTFIPGFNLMQIPVKFFSIVTFAGALLAGFGYERLKQMTKPGKTISVCIILAILIDLFTAGVNLNPVVKDDFYKGEPRLAKLIKGNPDYCRIFMAPATSKFFYHHSGQIDTNLLSLAKEALLTNLGLLHQVFDANGVECLLLRDYHVLMRMITTGNLSQVHQLLNLLNIKYIISRERLDGNELKLIEGETINIYENPTHLSRAFLVPNAVVIKDREDILRRMLRRDFDPQKEVIMEEEIQNQKSKIKNKSKIENRKSKIGIINYQPNKVIITASSPTDCFLFLSDTYYPGWKAYVDGVETKIYRADYIFRAIKLSKGEHNIEFKYLPSGFKPGCWLSFITAIFILCFGLVRKYIHRR